MTRGVWFGILALPAACSSPIELDLVPAAGTESVIIAVLFQQSISVSAARVGDSALRVELARALGEDDAVTVQVLAYRDALETLDLPEGELIPPSPSDQARVLPPYSDLYEAGVRAGAEQGFEAVVQLDPRLEGFRFATRGLECARGGGCFDSGACVTPCPEGDPLDAPESPVMPDPAALPVLMPCPPGWTELTTSGVNVCEPLPADDPCPPGQARFPGEAACVTIGGPCPAGPYAEDLPASGVVFVDPAAPAGGDGSRAAPLRTIAAARTSSAAVIALAKGTYDEVVTFAAGVELIGACAAQTIWGNSSGGTPTVRVTAGSLRVARVTFTGSHTALSGSRAGSAIHAEGVIFSALAGTAVHVDDGAAATLEEVAVRDVASAVTAYGASVDVRRARIERTAYAAVYTQGGSIALADTAIFASANDGVSAEGASAVRLERVLIAQATFEGLSVNEASTATATDLVVRDTRPDAEGRFGDAVDVGSGGHLNLQRAWLHRVHRVGVLALEPGTVARLEDVVIEDVFTEAASGEKGHGIEVHSDASLSARRVLLSRIPTRGFSMREQGACMAVDLTILDVLGTALTEPGVAVAVSRSAVCTGERWTIERATGYGVAIEASATLDLDDLVLRGVREDLTRSAVGTAIFAAVATVRLARAAITDADGIGLNFRSGALTGSDLSFADIDSSALGLTFPLDLPPQMTVSIERISVERAFSALLIDNEHATVAVSDLDASDTDATPATCAALIFVPSAIEVRRVDLLDLDRAAVHGASGTGLSVKGGVVTAHDLDVRRTRESPPCSFYSGDDRLPDRLGFGVLAVSGTLTLDGFATEENARAGVVVVPGADVTLANGAITGEETGLISPGFLPRDLERVRFEGNVRDLEVGE